MIIEKVLINSIKPYEKNAKIHTKAQIKEVANSIKEFGINQPLVIDKNNVLVVGHGRLEAAKLLKMTEIPVLKLANLTEAQINAYRLADNKLNESAWDMNLVMEELGNMETYFQNLTGFEMDDNKDLNLDLKEVDLNTNYEIVIECNSKNEQETIYKTLSKTYKCRILTL